ncbi:MAG TPA: Ivy family c-type lysozyme inhibitor [Rhodanobacteraceae bacterium]
MKQRCVMFSMMLMVAAATLVLGACSTQDQSTPASATTATAVRQASQKASVTTPLAAPQANHGGMQVVASRPDKQYLHDLMGDSGFAQAFAAMQGSGSLPAWVRQGGTATPAQKVTVDGRQQLLAQACKPHDCPSEQIVLLYDKAGNAMQGVFVRDPSPTADARVSSEAQFTWLGQPDAATQAWLKHDLTSR